MATMGRTLGIPSRVAVGFLHPQRSSGSTWAFSTHDLHAWPEMYFGGVGWVRFEPTPQGRTGDVPAYTTQQVPQAPTASSSSAPSAAPSVNRVDKSSDAAASAANQGGGGPPGPGQLAAWIGLPLLLLLVVLAPRALRLLVRRRRWAAAGDPAGWVEAAWLELRDTAVDLGVAWDDHVTLRTAATALEGSFGNPGQPDDALSRSGHRGPGAAPEATRALHRLVRLVERARYARSLPEDATTRDEVAADLDACVASLRAGAGRQRRTRARWLPASLLSQPRTRRRTRRRRALIGDPGVDRAV
jgi:hypothetical protein